jgi:cyclopropane fatty-acyl-phospholipid synthase-like methyltransferase
MSDRASFQPGYFDALYAGDADPWQLAVSDYEQAKYDATIAALPARRFQRALEVGCSIGVLTRRLAERCDSLLSIDVAEGALAQARRRCADLQNVAFENLQVPKQWPEGKFDLIVLSEVLYFLSQHDVADTAIRARTALSAAGTMVLVHYILPTNYPLTGDQATETFIAASGLAPTLQRREDAYRLDLLRA